MTPKAHNKQTFRLWEPMINNLGSKAKILIYQDDHKRAGFSSTEKDPAKIEVMLLEALNVIRGGGKNVSVDFS